MAASTVVSLEEYRRTSYRPDLEYIDGELKEKPVVQWTHSNLQVALSAWFYQHRKEWKIVTGVASRTQVSPARVRLPDVVVDHAGRHPEILTTPPLIVIEILSPSDSFANTVTRVQDYLMMGVPNVWILSPEDRAGFVCTHGAAPQTVSRFEVTNSPIYVDLNDLFAGFDEDNEL